LLMWLLLDMIALGNMGAPNGQGGLTSGNYGALFNVAPGAKYTLGDLTLLIASLMPTFANYDDSPNPSLNIYIDLDPQATMYGYDDGRVVAPGIQSIELMVNAEKYAGGGKTLNGINKDNGGEEIGVTFGYGATSVLDEAYVISINPRNLVTDEND